jgi:hypothetical protein
MLPSFVVGVLPTLEMCLLYLYLQSFHLWARIDVTSVVYFQVLLTIMIMWGVCGLLTLSGTLPIGHPARTDVKVRIIQDSPWFRFPYPGKWIRLNNSEWQEGAIVLWSRRLASRKRWSENRIAHNEAPVPKMCHGRASHKRELIIGKNKESVTRKRFRVFNYNFPVPALNKYRPPFVRYFKLTPDRPRISLTLNATMLRAITCFISMFRPLLTGHILQWTIGLLCSL